MKWILFAIAWVVGAFLHISSNTLFPMTAVRSYRCRNIYQVSLLKYKVLLVFYIKSDVFYIIFDVF